MNRSPQHPASDNVGCHTCFRRCPAPFWPWIPACARMTNEPLSAASRQWRVVYLSEASFAAGIEHHDIEGRQVPIYSVAKTMADCFKFRNRVGLDVALEALSDAWRGGRLTLAELNRFASINRVQSVMQPYIEALIQ